MRWLRTLMHRPPAAARRIGVPSDPDAYIEEIPGAILCPLTRLDDPQLDPATQSLRKGRFDGGVYRPDGTLWPAGASAYLNHENIAPARVEPDRSRRLRGRYLFAGLVQNLHFGHFLTENTTRLWGLDHIGPVDGILYLGRYPNQPLADYIVDLFRVFAPGVPLVPVTDQVQVDLLLAPQALCFPMGALSGHPLNRTFFKARIDALPPAPTPLPKRVFVSRSRLSRAAARFVLEEAIDANFRAQGYRVIHPETLSVREQLRLYAHASHLVFSEGSAIHLYALAARPGQKVYFIWRRQVMHPIFARQLDSFGVGPLEGENHVLAPLPNRRFPNDRARAASLLDFAALGADLAARGYVNGEGWSVPGQDSIRRTLHDLDDLFDTEAARNTLTG